MKGKGGFIAWKQSWTLEGKTGTPEGKHVISRARSRRSSRAGKTKARGPEGRKGSGCMVFFLSVSHGTTGKTFIMILYTTCLQMFRTIAKRSRKSRQFYSRLLFLCMAWHAACNIQPYNPQCNTQKKMLHDSLMTGTLSSAAGYVLP